MGSHREHVEAVAAAGVEQPGIHTIHFAHHSLKQRHLRCCHPAHSRTEYVRLATRPLKQSLLYSTQQWTTAT